MDMRVSITKEQFAELSGFAPGGEVIRLVIQQLRGQSPEIKKMVYEDMTPGQKALFAFWLLRGHSNDGWFEFFREGQSGWSYAQYLPVVKAGLQHINDQALLENIAWAERLYAQHRAILNKEQELPDFGEAPPEFAQASERLFALLPATMEKLEAYIRARPEEFVIFR